MRLFAKAITTFNTVNSFNYGNQWVVRAGEPNTMYFQLVDQDQASLRYIPAVGATINVTFPSIDDAQAFTVAASQADAADRSLWKVDLTNVQIPSSGNVLFAITESAVVRRFSALQFISVEHPTQDGDC